MELTQRYNQVTKEKTEEYGSKTVITDQDEIKKLYGDLNYRIETNTLERKLTIENNVLILKKNSLTKVRREGKQFFSKRLEIRYLKIDFNTGNFLTLYSSGGIKRKRQLIIRRNCFDKLDPFLDFNETSFWYSTLFEVSFEDNKSLQDPVLECFKQNYSSPWLYQDLKGLFTRIFIEKRGIKAPDRDIDRLITCFYPTQKFLKKNDNKLVQSVLDYLGMNDKYSLKLIHKYPQIDIRELKTLHHLLGGSQYLSNVNESVFGGPTKLSAICDVVNDPNITKFTIRVLSEELKRLPELTDNEKSNLVKVLNYPDNNRMYWPTILMDHFKMIDKIRPYHPNISMSSTTRNTFLTEHEELSNQVSKLNKGYVVSYKFNPYMVKDIETPLGINGEYVPYILKDENDYHEEGKHMRHCVGSYYDKDKSIIVSLRSNGDRWTTEFETKEGTLIQCLGKQNTPPPQYILDMIRGNLLKKTRTWSRAKKLKCMEKIITPLKINGIEIDVSHHLVHDRDLPF